MDVTGEYKFPDEDFCLFKNFPFEKLIICGNYLGQEKIAITQYLANPTCTATFLFRFILSYNQNKTLKQKYFENVKICNFTVRLKLCNNSQFKQRSNLQADFNIQDLVYGLKWAKFFGSVVSFPVVSMVGSIFNLIICLIIKKKHKKDHFSEQQRMFDFLFWNSLFNMTECLLSTMTLLGTCLGRQSLYCSKFSWYVSIKYFKLFGVYYFGEVLKTCSILTMLAFSFERYIATSQSKHRICKIFKKAKLIYILICFFALSALLCSCKCFEYELNAMETQDEYPELGLFWNRQYIWFKIIYLVHYIFNDGVILALNFFVDILLVVEIKKDLKIKKKLRRKNIDNEVEEVRKNLKKMIIYILIVIAFCRLPEFILYLFMLFFTFNKFQMSDYYNNILSICQLDFCPLLIDIIQFMYHCSYLTNLLFCYKFNKHFRRAFREFFHLKQLEKD